MLFEIFITVMILTRIQRLRVFRQHGGRRCDGSQDVRRKGRNENPHKGCERPEGARQECSGKHAYRRLRPELHNRIAR